MNPNYNNSFCKVLGNTSWDSYEYDTRINGEFFITEKDWNRSLITVINRFSSIIYMKEDCIANTIIVSTKVLDLICCLNEFSAINIREPSLCDSIDSSLGLIFYGNLGGRYKVYWDYSEKIFRKRNLILEKKDMNNTSKDFVLSFNKLKKVGHLIDVRF